VDASDNAAAQEAAALLAKIVADDIQEGPEPSAKRPGRPPKTPSVEAVAPGQGAEHEPRLRQGVAPDRVLSVVDPQMRWGHKSSQQRWAG
jgi:hypothetical protein